MKKILVFTLAGLLCLLMSAAGCTNTSPATTPVDGAMVVTSPATLPVVMPVTGPTWAGTWDSTFDGDGSRHVMILVQINETVTGTYAYNEGRILGTVQGNHLVGKWFENGGVESDRDSGPIDWVLSTNGNSFEGTWAYGDDGPDAMTESPGKWTGTRKL